MTYRDIDVANKTGVDPGLNVRASTLEGSGSRIEPVTSDEYFASLEPSVQFDLVFIDGLHLFEQTYRDFCNTILHTHERSVIVIDDTRPSDVFSALRNQSLAVKLRSSEQDPRTRGLRRGRLAWHGDVFKVVFAIHDFHPGFEYVTVVGSGNPQTIVWRSRDFDRSPRFDSFEAIGRLSYFDLLLNEDVLRPAAEDEALESCLDSLSGRRPHG